MNYIVDTISNNSNLSNDPSSLPLLVTVPSVDKPLDAWLPPQAPRFPSSTFAPATIVYMLAGKQLANAAVSLRVTSGSSSSSSDVKPGSTSSSSNTNPGSTSSSDSRRQSRENSVSTQKALDLLDAKEAQAGEGAESSPVQLQRGSSGECWITSKERQEVHTSVSG